MKRKEPQAREQHDQKRGGLNLCRPRGAVSKQFSNPMVILDLELGSGEGLPTLRLSHGHCVQLGMKTYIDLCWFCVTSDLSHN